MSDTAYTEGVQPDESSVIQELRAKLKLAERESRDAEQIARAKIKREQDASNLMPNGLKGLAGYFAQEVEGDLTAEAATEWLAARGITASLNPEDTDTEPAATPAKALENVTDLGAAVAAAASGNLGNDVRSKMEQITEGKHGAGHLPDISRELEALLSQG